MRRGSTKRQWLDMSSGWLSPDAYSTAWVAMVPDARHPDRPAWPQALAYVRDHQIKDGGWGTPQIYYAHERTLATLAAIQALNTWSDGDGDAGRIRHALRALWSYAGDLPREPDEPIGFELILPSLSSTLTPDFGDKLPVECWTPVEETRRQKMALINRLTPKPGQQQAWWFSLEALSEEQLASFDDRLLDENGAIAASTASTAAYLAARRRAGHDSPAAAAYLDRIVRLRGGGVPVGWPFDIYERVWALDSFMRAGMCPDDEAIRPVAESVYDSWFQDEQGLSFGESFRVNDGDDTLVGFTVLNWAGLSVPDDGVLAFWRGDHFSTYLDERGASISMNLHGLTALRTQPGFPHRALAERLTEWLARQIRPDVIFHDKWHISPLYTISHAIPAFMGWNNRIARRCLAFLIEQQRQDGGWGWFGFSTLEETAHVVLALTYTARKGVGDHSSVLEQAAHFLEINADTPALEPLWIGKGLHCAEGISRAIVYAARTALEKMGYRAGLADIKAA